MEQIDEKLMMLARQADMELAEIFKKIDDVCLYNSERILKAFISNKVSYADFADINGYGNYDAGRDKLEAIFAEVLGCEDALVRPQIMSGTNALYLTRKFIFWAIFLMARNIGIFLSSLRKAMPISNWLSWK